MKTKKLLFGLVGAGLIASLIAWIASAKTPSTMTFTVVNGGTNYTTPAVVITGGGGYGATATAHVSQGVIVSVESTFGGYNYTSNPTVEIRDPDPRASGAVVVVQIATLRR